jgi:hypothetical protein
MAMGRHGGNDPKEVAGTKDIAPFLFHHLYFLGNPNIPLPDDEKSVSVLFSLNHDISIFLKINKRQL